MFRFGGNKLVDGSVTSSSDARSIRAISTTSLLSELRGASTVLLSELRGASTMLLSELRGASTMLLSELRGASTT